MLPTQVIVALLVLQLALVVPLVAVVIQLLRLFHWRFRADPQARGERPHFTGPVLALLFSALAASDFIGYEPFPTLSRLNPVPLGARAYFTVVMLALAVWCWAYAGAIRERVRRLF
ncbi:hypothetical protein O9570_06800 [Achromobacter xylosoxidans]|jgi:hypothetical protein|uniref:Uncharacterized protein n=1 Tax=Alcaligenes xylosoxydans xylosoxydans TaxID=85698 RepID=A0A9X3KWL7_ALCXX|nr:hypothetical protein [Achromobacter xylosoxidans]MCZ8401145.1 hypothetical protein [Achromobacter xylosoxidans]CUJ42805.1 Uncharacterised protein [Achromobacter xylosoxidans]